LELDVLDWFILHIIVPGKPEVSVAQPEDAVIVMDFRRKEWRH